MLRTVLVVGVAVTVRSKENIDPDDGSTQEGSCSWWKCYLNSQIKPAWRCQTSTIQPSACFHTSAADHICHQQHHSALLDLKTWRLMNKKLKTESLSRKKNKIFHWKCNLKATPVLVGLIQLITDKQLHTSWKMWCSRCTADVTSNTLTCLFICL